MENNINLKKVFDDILDKKFPKNIVSGYDPLEVDIFLDSVRFYLVGLNDYINELKRKIRDKDNQIINLQNSIVLKENEINRLRFSINSYEKDGYTNQRLTKEVGDLRVLVSNLKKNEKSK